MGSCFGKKSNLEKILDDSNRIGNEPTKKRVIYSKLIRFKDGDTAVVLNATERIDIYGKKFISHDNVTVRIAGIDAPEMPKKAELAPPGTTPSQLKKLRLADLCKAHPEHPGVAAKLECESQILPNTIIALDYGKKKPDNQGKHGRLVADIRYIPIGQMGAFTWLQLIKNPKIGRSLASHMLETNHAVEFMVD